MKKSLAIFFILFFSFIFVQIAESQSIGDFRTQSSATGNWSGNDVWQICTSLSPETWTNTTSNPGSTLSYNVTIRSNSTITWSTGNISLNSGKTLQIESGSTLIITSTGIFSSSGLTNIFGTLVFNSSEPRSYPNYTGSAYDNSKTSYGSEGTCKLLVQPDGTDCFSFMGTNTSTTGTPYESFYNLSYIPAGTATKYFVPTRTNCTISGKLYIEVQSSSISGQPDVHLSAVQNESVPNYGPSFGSIEIKKGIVNVSSTAANFHRIVTCNGDFTIHSGTLEVNPSTSYGSTFLIKGNYSNSGGSINKSSSNQVGTIKFNGTSNQTITNSGNPSVSGFSVEVANTNGVTLNSNFTVPGTLRITDGLLKTGANTLTLDGGFVNNSPDATKMIVLDDGTNLGTLKRKVTSNIAYPFYVGDSRGTTEFSPVTLTFTGSTFSNAYIVLKMDNIKHPSNASTTNYISRYWEITTEGTLTNLNYTIRLQYLLDDITGNQGDLVLGKWNGSVWDYLGSPAGNYYFEKSGLTSFSTFTGGTQNAMPITLASFNYSVIGKDIKLNWSTSEEINNSGFDVERKSVSSDWQKVGFVQGNNKPSQYEFTERNLTTGKYQYRLKQIDFNGNFEYHNLDGYVEVGIPAKFDLSQNYPNPFNPVTKINFDLAKAGQVSLKVFDILGKEVKTLVNEFKDAGYYNITFDASGLPSGVYFYRISAGEFSSVKKLVLMK